MLLWILCGVAAALLIVVIVLGFRGLNPNVGGALFLAGIALMFCALMIVTVLVPKTVIGREHHETTHALTSVKASAEGKVEGDFFLGIGRVKGSTDEVYSYYYATRDAQGRTYQQSASAPTGISRVYEDGTVDPSVRHVLDVQTYGNLAVLPFSFLERRVERYEFTVPEDSVVRSFTLG